MMALMRGIDWLLQAYMLLVVLRAFLSWGFLPPTSAVYRWVYRLTEPLLAPLRRPMRRWILRYRIDFSPALLILVLVLVRRLLWSMVLG